jgi:hypothetical protein
MHFLTTGNKMNALKATSIHNVLGSRIFEKSFEYSFLFSSSHCWHFAICEEQRHIGLLRMPLQLVAPGEEEAVAIRIKFRQSWRVHYSLIK